MLQQAPSWGRGAARVKTFSLAPISSDGQDSLMLHSSYLFWHTTLWRVGGQREMLQKY